MTDLAMLLADTRVMSLGPGGPVESVRPRIEGLKLSHARMAGLWLRFDFFDESHRISQDLHTAEGSYWHAILHRREPDAWNSKYWFRQVGKHAVIGQLREQASQIGYEYADPAKFVDDCERARGTGSAEERVLEAVQMLEWRLLFEVS